MKNSLILIALAIIAVPGAYSDMIAFKSSGAVTYLSNGTSTTTDFPSPFTSANFTSAQTGPNAAVLSSTPFYATDASLTTAGAQWIGTSAGAGNGSTAGFTALFAIGFTVPDAFSAAAFTLNFEVDNELGDLNPGIYLNGIALPLSTGIPGSSTSSFNALQTYSNSNVAGDLNQGTNWLYIDAVNLGAEAGLIFSANISTTNTTASASPEPSALWLAGIGLAAIGAATKRR